MSEMPDSAVPAIAVTGLRKSYGKTTVLDGIDLKVASGTVFALLGPNGAGKTTTVQILSTLVPADSGQVSILGHDLSREPDAARHLIGVTGQFSAVDQLLSARENLRLMADLRHLGRQTTQRRTAELLERFDLGKVADQMVSTFSGGMRRKLDLAMTLIGEPRLIFLDEPTTGLDPRSRREMWQVVRELVTEGVTVFLTTQYLEEADQLSDRVAFLDHGHLIAQGPPQELKSLVPGNSLLLHFPDQRQLHTAAGLLPQATRDETALSLSIAGDGGIRGIREVLDRLDRASVLVSGMAMNTPDLEDVFLTLTGDLTLADSSAFTDNSVERTSPR